MNNESFSYTYSKKQSDEILKIRDKYIEKNKESTRYERIKQLDKSTVQTGRVVAIIVGVISSLIMGTGMCLVMVWNMMALGIAIGLIGIIGTCLTYPTYKSLVKSSKAKVKSEILRLCDEELNN